MKLITLDELAEEVRQGRTPPFEAWSQARSYERSLFPADTRWPVEGEIYECVAECEVSFTTQWHRPFTGGGSARLLAGDRVRILEIAEEKPVVVAARPLEFENVQDRIIPKCDREHPEFAGYSVSLRTRKLISHFRLCT